MWELYDELIAGIPPEVTIEDYQVGCAWTEMKARGKMGVALTVRGRAHQRLYQQPVLGAPLRQVAECVKSWHFLEASLGMAAINCWYNTEERVTSLPGFDGGESSRDRDAFLAMAEEARGKRVSVIGRFPHIERQLGPLCQLSVLERNPEPGDYPDSACEFLLPEQDLVFITGMTFLNKTLPRLLQLIRPHARVVLVGPSVPLTPVLAKYGVTDLSGFFVTDPVRTDEIIRRGDNREIFSGGRMVSVRIPAEAHHE